MTRETWTKGWGLLVERFCRGADAQPSDTMAAMYLEAFTRAGLTDDQFTEAVKRALWTIRYPGLPAAADIIQLVRPPSTPETLELEAGLALDAVLSLRSYHPTGTQLERERIVGELGRAAWDVCVAVGLQRLATVTDDSLPFVRREFVAAWKGARQLETFVDDAKHLGDGAAAGLPQLAAGGPKRIRGAGGLQRIGGLLGP